MIFVPASPLEKSDFLPTLRYVVSKGKIFKYFKVKSQEEQGLVTYENTVH
jgi:hypothetical protein